MEAIIPSSNNRVCMIYFYGFGNVGNTVSKLKDVKQISIYYEEGFCVTLDAIKQKNETYKIEGRSNLFVYGICVNNAYQLLSSSKVKSFNFATSNNQIFSFANFNINFFSPSFGKKIVAILFTPKPSIATTFPVPNR